MRHIVLHRPNVVIKKDLMSAAYLLLWMLFLIGISAGCRATTKTEEQEVIDIKSYYFPIHKLDGGMMFVYKYKNALMPEFYRHMQTRIEGDALYLKAIELREDFSVQQVYTEQIFPSGAKIIDYQIMDIDEEGVLDTAVLEIEHGDSYPFGVEEGGGVYIFQSNWIFPRKPEFKYAVVRNRRYGGDTTFVFKDERFPAVWMNVKELFVTEQDGRQELEFDKVEIYAKNLGLVYSKTQLNDSLSMEYQLVDTLAGSLLLSMD